MTDPTPAPVTPPWRFVTEGKRHRMIRLGVESFAEGLTEAGFLLLVTRVAFAIFDDQSVVRLGTLVTLSVHEGLALAFVAVLIRLALAVVSRWEAAGLINAAVADLRSDIAASFLNASWKVQHDQRVGSLQELMTSYSNSASSLVSSINTVILSAASLVALLGTALVVEPLGALFLFLSVAVLSFLLRPVRALVRDRARLAAEAGMQLAVAVGEISQLGMELHVFDVQDRAQQQVDGRIDEARERAQRSQFVSSLVSPIYTAVAYVALVAGLAVVAVYGDADVTALSAVMLLMLRSLTYGQGLQRGVTGVNAASPPVEEIQRRLAIFRDGRRVDGGRSIDQVRRISAEDLGFSYVPDEPVLRNVSFDIGPNEVVGIIGPSGGGKSTLVQTLLGLRAPDRGSIRADGQDIRVFARGEWARHVTFVPQESRLISASIAENIRFLREGVTRDEIARAARLAHLDGEILAHPLGYERPLGPGEGALSGGQQQRLCIARALVERPDLLILDEPTSALDARSEHLIRSTLNELRTEMNIVIIAHRLSTLDICDRIMVIQDGEIVAFDTPERLKSSNEFYRQALAVSGIE